MAISTLVYGNCIKTFGLGSTIIWKASGGTTQKITLMLDSHTPNKENDYRDDISASEATGQTPQTLTLSDPTAASGEVKFDVSDSNFTFTAPTGSQVLGGVACFRDSGAAGTSDLISLNKFVGGTVTTDGTNDVIVTPHADGFFKVTY